MPLPTRVLSSLLQVGGAGIRRRRTFSSEKGGLLPKGDRVVIAKGGGWGGAEHEKTRGAGVR